MIFKNIELIKINNMFIIEKSYERGLPVWNHKIRTFSFMALLSMITRKNAASLDRVIIDFDTLNEKRVRGALYIREEQYETKEIEEQYEAKGYTIQFNAYKNEDDQDCLQCIIEKTKK